MLGVSGTPVLDAVGKLRDLGDRPGDKRTLSEFDLWTVDPTDRSIGWIHLLYILSTTIRSDGDYPLEGIPLCLDSYYTLWDGRWCHHVSYLFTYLLYALCFSHILLTVRFEEA